MHSLTLVSGPTNSGHVKETDIQCNLTKEELLAAFHAGCEKLNLVGFGSTVFTHERRFLSNDQLKALNQVGLVSHSRNITLDNYPFIWLHIAKVGNNSLAWEVAEKNRLDICGVAIMNG